MKKHKELFIKNTLGLKHFDEDLLSAIEKELNRRKELLKMNYKDGTFIINKELMQ